MLEDVRFYLRIFAVAAVLTLHLWFIVRRIKGVPLDEDDDEPNWP